MSVDRENEIFNDGVKGPNESSNVQEGLKPVLAHANRIGQQLQPKRSDYKSFDLDLVIHWRLG